VLTLLLTSPRVAPGLLSWQAWSALRDASRVLVGSAGHPLVRAATEAGVIAEVVDIGAAAELEAVAAVLASAAGAPAVGDGPVVWLMPPGEEPSAALLDALSAALSGSSGSSVLSGASAAEMPVQIVHGSRDLPGAHLLDLVSIMDTLRVSCPWDREQTHSTLLPYLLEETYEAAEAIETSDWASLREELGDVLFQAVFHSRVAAERSAAEGGFTIDDVADELAAKLVRRHPHVFGSVAVSSAADVNRNWDEIKKAEKAKRAVESGSGPASVLDGVAFGQPALSLAAQLQRRAERAGAPVADGAWGPGGIGDRSAGGIGPEDIDAGGVDAGDTDTADIGAEGVGAELMRVVARARETGVDPEISLREAARRFAERVREWERSAG
jgi:XTP/dITP diphosphohydrolase